MLYDSALLAEDAALPMPLPAPVQLSPAALCWSQEPAPGAQTTAGIQPLPPWAGVCALGGQGRSGTATY